MNYSDYDSIKDLQALEKEARRVRDAATMLYDCHRRLIEKRIDEIREARGTKIKPLSYHAGLPRTTGPSGGW